jgi:hypothetical protein
MLSSFRSRRGFQIHVHSHQAFEPSCADFARYGSSTFWSFIGAHEYVVFPGPSDTPEQVRLELCRSCVVGELMCAMHRLLEIVGWLR